MLIAVDASAPARIEINQKLQKLFIHSIFVIDIIY